MTKQEMIDTIYERIANKELSFGCKIKNTYNNIISIVVDTEVDVGLIDNTIKFKTLIDRDYDIFNEDLYKIIGHPVMLGDMVDYLDKTFYKPGEDQKKLREQRRLLNIVWEDKRKSIDEQSIECIEYIYNLIK